jgi:hypothetical protein
MKNLQMKPGDVERLAAAGGFRSAPGQDVIAFTVIAHYAGPNDDDGDDQVAVVVSPGWVVDPLGQLAAALVAVHDAGAQERAERERREAS